LNIQTHIYPKSMNYDESAAMLEASIIAYRCLLINKEYLIYSTGDYDKILIEDICKDSLDCWQRQIYNSVDKENTQHKNKTQQLSDTLHDMKIDI